MWQIVWKNSSRKKSNKNFENLQYFFGLIPLIPLEPCLTTGGKGDFDVANRLEKFVEKEKQQNF